VANRTGTCSFANICLRSFGEQPLPRNRNIIAMNNDSHCVTSSCCHGYCIPRCEFLWFLKSLITVETEAVLDSEPKSQLVFLQFDALTALKMSMLVFWFVALCGLVGGYQRFGGRYYLHLQGWRPISTLPWIVYFHGFIETVFCEGKRLVASLCKFMNSRMHLRFLSHWWRGED
jgi:hypothetical protein